MIIIKINGGLGNQLQQYALYDKMRYLGKDVKVDISWFQKDMGQSAKRDLELDYFPGFLMKPVLKKKCRIFLEKGMFFAKY